MGRIKDIYDVSLDDEPRSGDPILFQNPEIRRMLTLANVGDDDVFYDLGCGWGQNILIALSEFKVKAAVGFEIDEERHRMAQERMRDWGFSDRCTIVQSHYQDWFEGKLKNKGLAESTVIFHGLSTSKRTLTGIEKKLKSGGRILYYYNCLFPEIMPDDVDFPFYVSKVPFRRPKSAQEWLNAVVRKKVSVSSRGTPLAGELWQELRHDYDVGGYVGEVQKYKSRLSRVL